MKWESPVRRQEITYTAYNLGGEAAGRLAKPPGKCFTIPALLSLIRAKTVYFTHGFVMIRINSCNSDLVCIVLDTVHDGVSQRIVSAANTLIPSFIEYIRHIRPRGEYPVL